MLYGAEEEFLKEKKFNVTVVQSLSKVDDVDGFYEEIDHGKDEEGNPDIEIIPYVRESYFTQHLDPLKIINECSDLAKELLEIVPEASKKEYYKWVIKECEGWIDDEIEVIPL